VARGDVHTYYEDGVWKNRVEGGVRASQTAVRRTDAVFHGKSMARKRRVTHLIHDRDGAVQEQNDFRGRR
jgi:hypothetical protein